MKRIAIAIVLLAPLAARAEEPAAGMPSQAFMLHLQLGATQALPIYGPNGTLGAGGFSMQPALVVGARLADRVELGVGLSYLRFAVNGNNNFSSQAFNIIAFTPTVAIDLVRSRDRKADLYARAGLPLASVVMTAGPANDNTGFAVGFQLGVGARYAFHPMFALGMEGGAAGQFINPQRGVQSTGFANFYGALTGTFFYGGRAK